MNVAAANTSNLSIETTEQTPYTRRARYFDSGNAFNLEYPQILAATFSAERDAAFAAATGTRLILCDQGAALGLDFPATSPLVLAAYARVAAGESLEINPRASVVLAYVIEGVGRVTQGRDVIHWRRGDVFSLPGGNPIQLQSSQCDSVLWLVTNEPQFAFERLSPAAQENSLVDAAHFPAATIATELDQVREKLTGQPAAGLALVFSSERMQQRRNISPTLTLAMNQLPPGGIQPGHSHNSVAVSLTIQGDNCYSKVDGARKDWLPYVTMVTPPTSVHSHHNEGAKLANWLIVQDGGIYYHCRTMGFQYETPHHR